MADLLPGALRIDVRHDGDVTTVALMGELDLESADALGERLASMTGSRVVVRLDGLELVDSTGLSVLLSARRAAAESGRALELRGATGAVRRVFEAGALDDVLDD